MKCICLILVVLLSLGCSRQIGVYDKSFIHIYPYQVYGKWGYFDVESGLIIAPKYQEAYLFRGELAKVKLNGKYGFINRFGHLTVKNIYDRASQFNHKGFAMVKHGNREFWINKRGKRMRKFKARPSIISRCHEPYKYVAPKKHEILENEFNKKAIHFLAYDTISAYEFDTIIPISNEFAIVGNSGKYGFHRIDMPHRSSKVSNGALLHGYETQYIYDEIKCKSSPIDINKHLNQFAEIRQGNKWGIISLVMKSEILSPKYLSIDIDNSVDWPVLFLVEYRKGWYGFVNLKGEELFPSVAHIEE